MINTIIPESCIAYSKRSEIEDVGVYNQCFQSLCPKIVDEPILRKAQFHGVTNVGRWMTRVSPCETYCVGQAIDDAKGAYGPRDNEQGTDLTCTIDAVVAYNKDCWLTREQYQLTGPYNGYMD